VIDRQNARAMDDTQKSSQHRAADAAASTGPGMALTGAGAVTLARAGATLRSDAAIGALEVCRLPQEN